MTTRWKKEAFRYQREWSQVLKSWKYFESRHYNLAKTYIALGLFGFSETDNSASLSLSNYHETYDNQQKGKIKNVFDQLLAVSENKNWIELSHTYLYLSEGDIVYCVFRCRTETKIYFVEATGRVYKSWNHFVTSNKLPPCEFVAPENGIYADDCNIMCYKTQTTIKEYKVELILDWVCSIAGIGCTILGMFSISPALISGTSVGIAGHCVYKSLSGLIDRSEHFQSIGLNNIESMMYWLNLGTSTIAGSILASPTKVHNPLSMVSESGTVALKTLGSLNVSDFLITNGSLGTQLLYLCRQIQEGKFTHVDALELAVQVFFLYGVVTDVDQLKELICSRHSVDRRRGVLQLLSDTWKRRLNLEMVHVRRCNPHTALQLLASRNSKISFQFLLTYFHEEEVVAYTCLQINDAVAKYSANKMINAFCGTVRPHILNLCALVEKNLKFWEPFVLSSILQENPYIRHSHVKDFGKLLWYAATEMDHIEQRMNRRSEPLKGTTADMLQQQSPPVDENARHIMILNVVRGFMLTKRCATSTSVILLFNDITEFVTKTVEETVTQNYHILRNANESVLGAEQTEAVFAFIEVNSPDDIFHNNSLFDKAIEKVKSTPCPVLCPVPGDRSLSPQAMSEIVDCLITIQNSLHSTISKESKPRLKETMHVIRRVSSVVGEKLVNEIENTAYEAVNSELDNFRSAAGQLYADEIVTRVLLSDEEADSAKKSTCVAHIRNEKKNRCEMLVDLCELLHQKVRSDISPVKDTDRILDKKRVFHFVVEKLISCMRTEAKNGVGNEDSLFHKMVEMISEDSFLSSLAMEYLEYESNTCKLYDCIGIWSNLFRRGRFAVRYLCYGCKYKHGDDVYYKSIASNLFNVNVGDEYSILYNESSILLQSDFHYIFYSFVIQNPEPVIVISIILDEKTG